MMQNDDKICVKVAIVKQRYCCLMSDNCQIQDKQHRCQSVTGMLFQYSANKHNGLVSGF